MICFTTPLWYLEWRCGSLQCDTEALEAYPSSYWWTYDYENKLPPGWWPCETYEGYIYYCHDDGRVQWEDPSIDYVVDSLPYGWYEAETESNGTTYKYYYYIDQDTGLVDNVQWEFPSTETFSVLDHTEEICAQKHHKLPKLRIIQILVAQVCTNRRIQTVLGALAYRHLGHHERRGRHEHQVTIEQAVVKGPCTMKSNPRWEFGR